MYEASDFTNLQLLFGKTSNKNLIENNKGMKKNYRSKIDRREKVYKEAGKKTKKGGRKEEERIGNIKREKLRQTKRK